MATAAEIAIIVVSLCFVAMMTAVAVITWRMVRRFRIWRDRVRVAIPQRLANPTPEAMAQALSGAHRSTLAARAVVVRGNRRQALRLRRDLWTHVDASTTAVNAAQSTGVPVGDLPYLVGHLRDQARRHDHALVLVGKGVPAMDLVTARAETERINAQADQVSTAVVEAMRSDATIHPDHLSAALDREARSVSAGAAAQRSLTAN
jgi:hypothetical protein